MLRVHVERRDGAAAVSLRDADGETIAEWVQPVTEEVLGTDRPQLSRSGDGDIATVVVDDVITVVRLPERRVVSSDRAGHAIEASFALDARWTLELAGELMVDGGFSGHYSGSLGFVYAGPEPRPDAAALAAEVAQARGERAAAANL